MTQSLSESFEEHQADKKENNEEVEKEDFIEIITEVLEGFEAHLGGRGSIPE